MSNSLSESGMPPESRPTETHSSEPRASAPGAPEPDASEPGASEPGASEPRVSEPGVSEPGASDSRTADSRPSDQLSVPPNQVAELAPLLVFGAHPDDIEFGCGAVVFKETQAGRKAHFVITSRGETGTSGTPEIRAAESTKAAELLGATIEFIELDGDAHLEVRAEHAVRLAEIIRLHRPSTVLAPTCVENQHPDHWRLGKLVRDAARLARYGGLKELLALKAFAIEQLLFFAVTPEAVPHDVTPLLVDVSAPDVFAAWTAAMNAHVSQAATRNYIELQHTRARLLGVQAGVEHAIALYPSDALVFDSLSQIGKGARRF